MMYFTGWQKRKITKKEKKACHRTDFEVDLRVWPETGDFFCPKSNYMYLKQSRLKNIQGVGWRTGYQFRNVSFSPAVIFNWSCLISMQCETQSCDGWLAHIKLRSHRSRLSAIVHDTSDSGGRDLDECCYYMHTDFYNLSSSEAWSRQQEISRGQRDNNIESLVMIQLSLKRPWQMNYGGTMVERFSASDSHSDGRVVLIWVQILAMIAVLVSLSKTLYCDCSSSPRSINGYLHVRG